MSKNLLRVLTLGFVIGGVIFAFSAAPRAEQPQPEVKVEEKTSTKPEGEAKPKVKPQVKSQPQPKPKPLPSNPGNLSCDKTTAQKYVNQKSAEIGLQWQYAYGVVAQESGWNCQAYSAGNYGMWQINLPSHPNISPECAYDLVCSTNWAVPHLKYLIDTYGLRRGLSAYNAGAGGMRAGKGFVYADEVIHRINNNLF